MHSAPALSTFLSSAQRTATSPLLVEIGEQLKDAIGRMRSGQANGARQAATVLRVYASTVNNGQLQALLRKANRQQLLLTEMNHGELVRQAKELGIDPSRLPPHSVDRVGREVALDRLIKEGVSPFMRTVADYVDGVAEKMERLERRSGGAVALQIALRQPIPDQVDCGNCNQEQQQVDNDFEHRDCRLCRVAHLSVLGRSVRRGHGGLPHVLLGVRHLSGDRRVLRSLLQLAEETAWIRQSS